MGPLILKIHHWKMVMIIVALVIFVLVMIIGFFYDSPRYYISRYDYESASYVAMKFVGKRIEFEDTNRDYSLQLKKWMKRREEEAYPFSELFTYPSIQAATYIMVICCFNFNNMYKGMVLISEAAAASNKNSYILFAIFDFFACIIAGYLLTKFGRSAIIKNSFNATCVLAILISFFTSLPQSVQSILMTVNRFTSLITLCGGYLYAIEAFPTRIRGLGIGFCSIFSNIGKILAIVIVKMGSNCSYIFGILGIIGFYMLMLVPDIKDMKEDNLLDEIVEVQQKLKSKS